MGLFAGNDHGLVGTLVSTTNESGATVQAVLPQIQIASSSGAAVPAATAADPTFTRTIGAPNFATNQGASSVSPANATLVAAARAGRHSVTFTNITGTQPVYFVNAANITGVSTGFFLAGTVGASVTIPTSTNVYATSPTAAQTLGVLETY